MGVSTDDEAESVKLDDLGLSQFSPEVLEFMLGVVRVRKKKRADIADSHSGDMAVRP